MQLTKLLLEIVKEAPESHDNGITNVTCSILNIFDKKIYLADKIISYAYLEDGSMSLYIQDVQEHKLTTLRFIVNFEYVRWHLEINNLLTFPEFVAVNERFTEEMQELAESYGRALLPEFLE